MIELILTRLSAGWRRSLAIMIAVIIGVAFVTAALLSGSLLNASIAQSVGAQLRGTDVLLAADSQPLDRALVERISQIDGVQQVAAIETLETLVEGGGTQMWVVASPLPRLEAMANNLVPSEGRLPQEHGEILIDRSTADYLGLGIGDSLTWTEGSRPTFQVVGIVESGVGREINATSAWVTESAFASLGTTPMIPWVAVDVSPGSSTVAVQNAIEQEVGDAASVMTFDQAVDSKVDAFAQGAASLQIVLMVFALIALFAAAIVISNTFQITVAQRSRELALMRCVGASRRQIRTTVLAEAAALGIVAAVLGLGLGYGIMAALATVLWDSIGASALVVTPLTIAIPFLMGLVVTVASSWPAAKRATAVRPLEAIRQSDAPVENEKLSRTRTALAIGASVLGALVLAGALAASRTEMAQSGLPLLVGVLGGMISFLGLLLSARIIVPALLRGIHRTAGRIGGVPAELAISNMERNPDRTSSTATALLMGVTLIALMVVAATSVKQTFVDVVESRGTADIELRLSNDEGQLEGRTIGDLRSIDGVERVETVSIADVTLGTDGYSLPIVSIDGDDARSIVRSDATMRHLRDDTVIVPTLVADGHGIVDGEAVILEGETGVVERRAVVVDSVWFEVYVTPSTYEATVGTARPNGAWLRLDDSADVQHVSKAVGEVMPNGVSYTVGGSAIERRLYLDLIDNVLLGATALTGAAVLIAIVGVGNTLTLSVLERRRESGMLRAMGLTGRQLKRSLAIEGVLISLVGAAIGLVAGTIYGWIGAMTIFGNAWDVSLGWPVGRMAIVAGVAIVAGWLASVMPARQAARVSPVEALATSN